MVALRRHRQTCIIVPSADNDVCASSSAGESFIYPQLTQKETNSPATSSNTRSTASYPKHSYYLSSTRASIKMPKYNKGDRVEYHPIGGSYALPLRFGNADRTSTVQQAAPVPQPAPAR